MSTVEDIAQKRAMLSTIRMHFAPQTQPIKETAIDKILEQNIFFVHKKKSITLQDMKQHSISNIASSQEVLSSKDIENSIKRLVEKKRFDEGEFDGKKIYKLSDVAFSELEHLTGETKIRFEIIVKKLFRNIPDPLSYSEPFLRCLSIIFSDLGERYVSIIKGDVTQNEVVSSSLIASALSQIKKQVDMDKTANIGKAVLEFFRESNPQYDAVKWNMAQNYYIAKVIGLEPDSQILSQELFGDAILYLDTNILVSALEEEHKHHESFKELSMACSTLNIQFRMCQLSIEELRGFINNKRGLLEKVADQIPAETVLKVRGVFLKMYEKQLREKGTVDFDELFASFNSPIEDLRSTFNVELEDDEWFDEARYDTDIQKFSKELIKKYEEIRGHPKNGWSAMNDAILIWWLKKMKSIEKNKKIGLVTLDTSLPGILKQGEDFPFIITLDALLQWLSPVAIQSEDEGKDFAKVFSGAIKYQILPQETFFELKDFIVFADMQMSCKELPAEDVEECIQYLKSNAPKLDPSKAEDREKISYEISKFFADSGRKFHQEIVRLEAENSKMKMEYGNRIKTLEEQNKKIMEETKKENLRSSGLGRLSVVILFFIIYEAIVCYFANNFAEGNNFFQKIKNSWPYLTLGAVLAFIISWFYIGKERIEAMGWSFKKLLKHN